MSKKEVVTAIPAMTPQEIEAAGVVANQEVVASDVLIPRLLLMQGISPLVSSRKAQIGDMVRSTTNEKVGNPEKPVELIPLKMVNSWINFEDTGQGQPSFRGMEERGAHNEQLPWEYVGPNGEDMFRKKAITLYGLLPGDVAAYNTEIERSVASGEAPDLNRTVLPVVVTFQSTSFKYAGKKCASFFNNVRVNSAKIKTIAPFQYVLTLTCREEKNAKNSWYIFDMEAPKPLKDVAIRAEAANWAKILGSTKVRVDDSGEVSEGSGSHSEMEI